MLEQLVIHVKTNKQKTNKDTSCTVYQNNLKYIIELNIKAKILKPLEEKVGKNLWSFG